MLQNFLKPVVWKISAASYPCRASFSDFTTRNYKEIFGLIQSSETEFFGDEITRANLEPVLKKIAELSGGLLRQGAEVTLNRRVLDYDLVCVVGPVFPHEVVGFSGGAKYFFPGIAGEEIIDLTHWVGALITSVESSPQLEEWIQSQVPALV